MTKLDPTAIDAAQIVHSTFKLERHFKHAPAKVFETFADQKKKEHWFVASDGPGWTTNYFEMDFRVGGYERGSWFGPDGITHANETSYLDIIENQLIALACTMAMDGVIHSASLATITFGIHDSGMQLTYTEQGAYYGGSDGTPGRTAGWEHLLNALEIVLGR